MLPPNRPILTKLKKRKGKESKKPFLKQIKKENKKKTMVKRIPSHVKIRKNKNPAGNY